ncbi:hypothetical protein [Exiguobacterium sp. S90]|uniref:hypothetical protein n=1 Tax=Exiguobacterium sp. S90 TaxID=1221231 RepID=UPI001BE889E9|nr:hypothetical protein [Exiguobacterium sp. S90]
MYGIISSPRNNHLFKSVSEEELVFEAIDEFGDTEFLNACTKVSRVTLNYVLIDLTCASEQALTKGIINIVLNKPSTRIITVGIDLKVGDKTLSLLISSGIYDIVSLQDPTGQDYQEIYEMNQYKLTAAIEERKTLADAIRWKSSMERSEMLADYEEPEIADNSKEIKVKEKIIVKEVVKTKVINVESSSWFVVNLTRRAGTSLVTQSLAKFLADMDFDIRVTESPFNKPTFLYSTGNHYELPSSIIDGDGDTYYQPYEYKKIKWDLKTSYREISFEDVDFLKLLIKVKQGLNLIDVGDSYFERPQIMQDVRKLIVVLEPEINGLWECRERKKQIDLLSKKGVEVIYVINKSHDLISDEFASNNGFENYVFLPILDSEIIYKRSLKNQLLLNSTDDIDDAFIQGLNNLSKLMSIPIYQDAREPRKRRKIRIPFLKN